MLQSSQHSNHHTKCRWRFWCAFWRRWVHKWRNFEYEIRTVRIVLWQYWWKLCGMASRKRLVSWENFHSNFKEFSWSFPEFRPVTSWLNWRRIFRHHDHIGTSSPILSTTPGKKKMLKNSETMLCPNSRHWKYRFSKLFEDFIENFNLKDLDQYKTEAV